MTVLNWVAADGAELGVDRGRLAVAGSSAGAALAARLAQCAAEGRRRPSCSSCCTNPCSTTARRRPRTEFIATPGSTAPRSS